MVDYSTDSRFAKLTLSDLKAAALRTSMLCRGGDLHSGAEVADLIQVLVGVLTEYQARTERLAVQNFKASEVISDFTDHARRMGEWFERAEARGEFVPDDPRPLLRSQCIMEDIQAASTDLADRQPIVRVWPVVNRAVAHLADVNLTVHERTQAAVGYIDEMGAILVGDETARGPDKTRFPLA